MREIRNEPILTQTFETTAGFRPADGSLYVYGQGQGEERSQHLTAWQTQALNVQFLRVHEEGIHSFKVVGRDDLILLRSNQVRDFFLRNPRPSMVYIDITGLTHPVWAGLLRGAFLAGVPTKVVYVEPDKYSRSSAPLDGQIYDLSARIAGIAPIPGYAVFRRDLSSESVFVPLLGFEGPRLRHIIEEVQPAADKIIPVVGSPGFKPWYVFETYKGNKAALLEEGVWQAIRYAPADCPFSCFYLLASIAREYPQSYLKIAPIGTKPHALGAVMFALTQKDRTELVYDHPIRKPGRTEGASQLHVYNVSSIAQSLI